MHILIVTLLEDNGGNQCYYTRRCWSCNQTERPLVRSPTWTLPVRENQMALTTELKHWFKRTSDSNCERCGAQTVEEITTLNTDSPPPFIALGLEDRRNIGEGACQPKITAQVSIGEKSDKLTYKVRGLIYWDHSHFTCRMIGKAGEVYYNDGMTTGATFLS